jgi:nucleoside-diphosphate-sugar epimerase
MAVIGDPETFPITVDHPRDPLNWYGRTKLLNERAIEDFADGAFPAHQFMISNLYGSHTIDGRPISKGTVINFFLGRALAGDPITVYEPGTQSRNFVHVTDVARAYVHSAERLLDQRAAGTTGVEKYELASDEDPSVATVADLVSEAAAEVAGIDAEVRLVENPRGDGETMVESFPVDTSRTRERLGWQAQRDVETTIRDAVADATE